MTRITTSLSASAALVLVLAACSTAAPTDGGGSATASATSPSSSASSPSSSSPSPGSATTAPTDDGTGTGTGTDDRTASGLAAIDVAETETGGIAYAIDDSDDDGGWEVDVRTGDTSVEVRVGDDGVVRDTEADDLDGDDRRILDTVEITLAQAIEAAVAETGGILDDADLTDDDGNHVEVTVDTADRTDLDVHLDPVTGEVLRVG